MKNKKLYPLLLMMFVASFASSQQDSAVYKLASFVNNIRMFNHLYPQEKVYLHFDNTGYFLGETIWFKAYVVNADDLLPDGFSRILHVELLTQEGERIATQKLKIENGQCHGDFRLEPDYRSGFYEVRAYTRSMLNFGEDCVFSRVFPVYKEPENEGDYSQKSIKESFPFSRDLENGRKKAEKRKAVNIAFYPEGGNLIKGLPNRIAFHATDKNGENIDVDGVVLGVDGQESGTFSTLHQGMGVFSLLPEEGLYRVKVTYRKDTYIFDLPPVLASGYNLSVNSLRDDMLLLQVAQTSDLPTELLGISVACRGRISYFDTLQITSESLDLNIAKEPFPAGVNCLTLFNTQGEVLAERLFFVSRPPETALTCMADKERYQPLEKVQLDFSVRDRDNRPVAAAFSVSVRDASTSAVGSYAENIQTNLLLSSDLKGYIEHPAYYFEADDNQHKIALDLLMMVQGWRRYAWKRMADKEPFEVKHPIEESLMIKGQVLNYRTSGVQPDVKISYHVKSDSRGEVDAGLTDQDGRFVFLLDDSLNINGRWNLVLQTHKKGKPAKSRILLDRQFSPQGKAYSWYEMQENNTILSFDDEWEDEEKKRRSIEEIQPLNEVTVKARKRRQLQPNIIYYIDRDINDMADKGEFYPITIAGYLEDKDSYIDFNQMKYGEKTLTYCYDSNNTYRRGLNVLDFNVETANTIRLFRNVQGLSSSGLVNSDCLEHISNVERSTNYKFVYMGIQLKEGKIYRNVPDGVRLTYFEGYSQSREYAKTLLIRDPVPGDIDHRRTLYWNPDVRTDAEGKASAAFYNNSTGRHILIHAEGLTDNGNMISMSPLR
ncbi:MAG: hypothetical protein LBM08_05470 [Dysgonamonadaceae bacterium]|jgi:hypothetical protein|nr:hypothetical protein [Dysgonamonadaceae bacterium]